MRCCCPTPRSAYSPGVGRLIAEQPMALANPGVSTIWSPGTTSSAIRRCPDTSFRTVARELHAGCRRGESIELAYTREASAAPEEPAPGTDNAEIVAPVEEPKDNEGGVTNALNIILRVAGFIVLALAIAVAVLFVLSRRSA